MTISKEVLARNAACNAIVQLVDSGSTYPQGHLSIYDASANLIFWHPLSNPSFSSSLDGTSISATIFDAVALIDGTATNFAFENRDGSAVWNGDVGISGSGASLQLESTIIAQDSTNSMQSAIYVVPS